MTSKRKRPNPLPELPLAVEVEIDPAVAAIKQAHAKPLPNPNPRQSAPELRGNWAWENQTDPELREAWTPTLTPEQIAKLSPEEAGAYELERRSSSRMIRWRCGRWRS